MIILWIPQMNSSECLAALQGVLEPVRITQHEANNIISVYEKLTTTDFFIGPFDLGVL